MRKRKTKGSSMLIVIALFGILSILGVSMLATTTASYKLRIEESNRTKGLYAAESGIDLACIKMNEEVQEALDAGINGVKEKIDEISQIEDKYAKRAKINEVYKDTYEKYIDDNLKNNVSGKYKYFIYNEDGSEKSQIESDVVVDVLKLNTNENYSDRRVTLTSTYKSQTTQKERVVSVSYLLEVPKEYRIESSKGEEVSNLINYTIASDGDLIIADSSLVDVNGDIWINGSMAKEDSLNPGNSTPILIDDKYNGGIHIVDSNVNFNGNVVTASNINISNIESGRGSIYFTNNKVGEDGEKIPQEIFAENILLGNINDSNTNSNIIFDGINSHVYLSNDLVIGANDVRIVMDRLYGFNDISTDVSLETLETISNAAIRGSSSIIVNSEYWPFKDTEQINKVGELRVNTDAYIMGSAYIKTKKPYQTGESVALKGNYNVYTEPKSGYQYEYMNPLYLVTKDQSNNKLDLNDKIDYFVSNVDSANLRTEGIILPPTTKSIGAYISNGKVITNNLPLESQTNEVKIYKRKYVDAAYNMMDKAYVNDNTADYEDDFLSGYPKRNVANEINWDGVDYLVKTNGNIIELNDTTVIVNNDKNKEINLIDTATHVGSAVVKLGSTYLTTIDTTVKEGKEKRRYVIITEGDVNVSSEYDLNGSIIAKGNINIKNSSCKIGMRLLNESELSAQDNVGVLDRIFTLGKRGEGNLIIKASDLISKERWELKK